MLGFKSNTLKQEQHSKKKENQAKKEFKLDTMKFKMTKSKINTGIPSSDKPFITSNNFHDKLKETEIESKSANMLFSIKTKTKMKRSHHKMHGIVLNPAVISSESEADFNNQNIANLNVKTDRNVKKVSLKQIGVSFANLFKPNKRTCGRTNQNIEIDNEKIFFPVPIRFDESTKRFESPKSAVKNFRTGSLDYQNLASQPKFSKSVSSLHNNLDDKSNLQRKMQPSMGVKAYNFKTKSKCEIKMEDFNNEQENEIRPRMFKNKSMMINNELKSDDTQFSSAKSESNLMKDLKNNEEFYDCLINYESQQLYRTIADDLKAISDEIRLNYNVDTVSAESENNLVPFLDHSRETCIQPLLSSTTAEFEMDIENPGCARGLHLTPLRNVSNISKMKKLRSFSNLSVKNE